MVVGKHVVVIKMLVCVDTVTDWSNYINKNKCFSYQWIRIAIFVYVSVSAGRIPKIRTYNSTLSLENIHSSIIALLGIAVFNQIENIVSARDIYYMVELTCTMLWQSMWQSSLWSKNRLHCSLYRPTPWRSERAYTMIAFSCVPTNIAHRRVAVIGYGAMVG
jgi:hypothetical protein